jgi:hypothetical protein
MSQYKNVHNVVTGIIHKPRKLRLPNILEFTLTALEPSSVFSIDISRDAASAGQFHDQLIQPIYF